MGILKRLADARNKLRIAEYYFNVYGNKYSIEFYDNAKKEFNEALKEVEALYIPV